MPTYVYAIIGPDGEPSHLRFEAVQRMADDAYETVPDGPMKGSACRRVILAPRVRIGKTKEGQINETPDHLLRPVSRRESIQHWYPASQVEKARREIGGQAGRCIQDDGRVVYENLADERRFKAAAERMDKRKAERAEARAAKETARAISGQDAMEGSQKVRKIPKALAKRRPEFS